MLTQVTKVGYSNIRMGNCGKLWEKHINRGITSRSEAAFDAAKRQEPRPLKYVYRRIYIFN